MSNILPDSDEEKKADKMGRRRRSKLSDLNAVDSADDDSEFQASDFSGEIEVNRKKKHRNRRKRAADSEDEDSEAMSDASWGRANIRSSRKSGGRKSNSGRDRGSKSELFIINIIN